MPKSTILKSTVLPGAFAAPVALATLLGLAAPAAATECAQHIQAIERRMHSTGASEVTGKPASPSATSPMPNEQHHAAAPDDAAQKATPEKMKKAEALLAKAKDQDKAGNKDACEQTMQEVQANMGALP